MTIETWMTPDEFAAFLWHLENDPPLAPVATPLLDAFPREPSKAVVHEWAELRPEQEEVR